IQKAGGGTGFSFDRLRPCGDYIATSGGTTSGPISFWRVLSEATNAIQQGAFRRGANMGMMSVTHPDILKFINAKQNLHAFTNFNISVKVSDAWMNELQQSPNTAHRVINPRDGREYVIPLSCAASTHSTIKDLIEVSAYNIMASHLQPPLWTMQAIYDLIVSCAWRSGEPGLIFIDAINRANPTPNLGMIEATNPCGEQPLLPYESCNLGSINVARFVVKGENSEVVFDWDGLKKTVQSAVRFLDNIIDINLYPVADIEVMSKSNRKIGLGIMGFADLLFLMHLPYDSEEAVAFGEKLMQFINDESHQASEALANQRGNFPNWAGSVWDTEHHRPMRNATTTTVAPTGTISIIADCSSGIEPLFSLAFFRHVLDGKRLVEVNQTFKKELKRLSLYSDEMIALCAEKGTIANVETIPEQLRRVFVCAHDIAPHWHVRMQAAFQKHCDSSISKTINLPHTATIEEVRSIYELAWKLSCKGVTVYRDGCRQMQPMALSSKENQTDEQRHQTEQPEEQKSLIPVHTPAILSAIRIRQNTPFGHMHVTITVDPKKERELEVFAQLGKAGDVAMSDLEAISRLISLYLRIGGSLDQIINQLEGIGSHLSIPTKDGRVMSLADGLGKTLHRYLEAKKLFGLKAMLTGDVDINTLPSLKDLQKPQASSSYGDTSALAISENSYKVKCPECGVGVLQYQEGCVKCCSCGFSRC
ncbi:MAG: adenosylcobalamin-dependent ribonucleoside-diphosphate reductase, partial [Chitinivibrionales bacterium]|nr:adenosylcobalamin-dependent ribonucleoside-diphosphate reductase [Chitinivibrionales bacterium]